MTDPFAAALTPLFNGPGAVAADYTAAGGEPVRIRVIRDQRTDEAGFNGDTVLMDANLVQIQRSDIAQPAAGDRLAILHLNPDGSIASQEDFTIQGGARLDVEGLTWNCALEPA